MYKLKRARWTVHDKDVEEVRFKINYQAQLNTEVKEDQNNTNISPELQT